MSAPPAELDEVKQGIDYLALFQPSRQERMRRWTRQNLSLPASPPVQSTTSSSIAHGSTTLHSMGIALSSPGGNIKFFAGQILLDSAQASVPPLADTASLEAAARVIARSTPPPLPLLSDRTRIALLAKATSLAEVARVVAQPTAAPSPTLSHRAWMTTQRAAAWMASQLTAARMASRSAATRIRSRLARGVDDVATGYVTPGPGADYAATCPGTD